MDAAWNLSPKTKLGARYTRDIGYSAFATTGPTPTNLNETAEVYLDKLLASNLYFRLFGRLGTLVSDGAITVVTPDGIETAVRDDRVREAGAELGYQFRTRVRIGVTATYTTRRVDRSRRSGSRGCWPGSPSSTTRRSRRSGRGRSPRPRHATCRFVSNRRIDWPLCGDKWQAH